MAGDAGRGARAAVRAGGRWAAALAGGAAVYLTGMALLQDRLLYYPEAASVEATLAAAGPAATAWPAGADFRGVLVEPPRPGPAVGTVVLFHGNAGHAGQRGEYADRLGESGWRVLLAEYPGYGARSGRPGEAALVADAVDTARRARRQFGPPLVLAGESLGAAVAAGAAGELVGRGDAVDGLLLITPWDRLANVAAHHYPWLPVSWLLADRYDSVAALRGYPGPGVVVVAAADDLVPARHGRALYDALGGRKALHVVAQAGHNDWLARVDAIWWRDLLRGFGG